MSQNWPFKRNDVFPSWFANRIQDFLSAAESNLRLTRKDNTTVQVIPDTALGIAAVAIDGRWRFNEATVERAHPGGAKGTYVVWAVAEDSDVDNTPAPHSDHTKYTFELRITSGAKPEGAGIEVVEKIGEVDWSGTEIEAVRQTLNSVTGPMIADGTLSNSGDIEWKREANGAWVPQLKASSVTAAEMLDGTVGTAEIADALKPSKGAVAGTEALRALGATASTAAAGNDARLSDERTPKDNSVTSAKILDGTIGTIDLGTGVATSPKFKPTAGVVQGEGAEEAHASVLPKKILPVLKLTPAVTSFLLCWVTGFWTQEGAEARVRIGVRVGAEDFQAVANPKTIFTGWQRQTVFIKAEVPASEKEIWMTFTPQIVGGGQVYKLIGEQWSMMYMLVAA